VRGQQLCYISKVHTQAARASPKAGSDVQQRHFFHRTDRLPATNNNLPANNTYNRQPRLDAFIATYHDQHKRESKILYTDSGLSIVT
jgi:4-hydroxy-L-threonine phosphate dehydrogenase PdxA